MLELNSKVLELKFNGEALKMRFPTISELSIFQKKDIDDLEKTKELFIKLGMSEEIFNQLHADHLVSIMESFSSPKN